jgi:deoxyribodipyrimidine photolyase-related protein
VATTVRLILGDQLNPEHSWFKTVNREVLYVMMEVRSETDYVVHHAQKVIAIFAGMRSLAETLGKVGHQVRYFKINDTDNQQSLVANLKAVLKQTKAKYFEYQEPDEWRLDQEMKIFTKTSGVKDSRVSSEHFLDVREGVASHFQKDAKRWLMESYYRKMRIKTGFLMDEAGTPLGGQWNYDHNNRLPWKGTPVAPKSWDVAHNYESLWKEITQAGIKTMGDPSEKAFPWPRNRPEALLQLSAFIKYGLPNFGSYEDAMHTTSDRLFHSRLSFALNVKLLSPHEVALAAVQAYERDSETYPLAATEGFVRQIIGWREYVRGVYWAKMPGYEKQNDLDHQLPLPSWFWTGKVKMNCLRHSVGQSLQTAYAHHIQRLMVIGSFCLNAGINPAEVEQWFLGVYVDAFQWVELPNVIGMSQHADGGFLASKPYNGAASYINKMSNYCGGCPYDPKDRTGPLACPFNALYWDFWLRHRQRFLNNPRIGMAVRQAANMSPAEQKAVVLKANTLRAMIEEL